MADPLAVTVPLLPLPQGSTAPTPAPAAVVREEVATEWERATADQGRAATVEAQRMWLHTELIRAGVPPHTGDLRTIGQLAELDQEIVETVVRWIEQSARRWAASTAWSEAATEPDGARLPPDPRLSAW